MMNLAFLGVAGILFLAAAYWARGRGGHRPTGTAALCGLLASFAFAFASYAPAVQNAAESLVPHVARLISNSFTLAAAASVLAFTFQLNLEPEEARRRIRMRLVLLGVAVAAMSVLFVAEYRTDLSPQSYAVYVLIYISYLGYTALDFLRQTWAKSKSSRRTSQRIGLRMTAVGCVFALVYASYKIVVLVSVGLELGLIPEEYSSCSSFVVPAQCAFSVTAPAVAVLLITAGLTLPAVSWPISQYLRRRWELRSFEALGPLWQELATVTPQIVLAPPSAQADAEDPDFLLHRRVIEINDGILALRPYRALAVQQAAASAVTSRAPADSPDGSAIVEAAVLSAAVLAKRSGREPSEEQALPAPGTVSRAGNLRAETEWLLRVARACAGDDIVRAATQDQVPSDAV